MSLIIRKLCEIDIEAVSRMEEVTFSMPWPPQAFIDMMDAPNALYLVAELDGLTVGCCGMTNIAGEGNINNVMVTPECRGRGIGYAILKELLFRGKEMGIQDYTLEVRVSNAPAIHVYEKLGFIAEGIRPDFYEKPREDALIMWLRSSRYEDT